MLVNQRIKAIREHRRLEGRELASMAGLSAGEISHIERNLRTPKIETLQKIAAALDVLAGFLLGEDEDAKLSLPEALARQSLKLFLRQNQVLPERRAYFARVLLRGSPPQTVAGWAGLLANIEEFSAASVVGQV